MNYNYAIQRKDNGQVYDYCETKEQAKCWLDHYEFLEVVSTSLSSVKVSYCELGGPYGYGHQEESFATYGGLLRCVINLYKWMQETARTFGPDARDIRDFFRYCHLQVNGQDKTVWLIKQVDKLTIKELYV